MDTVTSHQVGSSVKRGEEGEEEIWMPTVWGGTELRMRENELINTLWMMFISSADGLLYMCICCCRKKDDTVMNVS